MSTSFNEPGIVLRISPVKEADLIASILTENNGKISVFARGARKSKKRYMGGIDVFDCALFEYVQKGEQDLYFLNSLCQREVWTKIRNSLKTFALSSLCIEATNIFAHEGDPEGKFLFAPLRTCMRELNQADNPKTAYQITVQYFLELLSISGYDPLHAELEVSEDVSHWWQAILQEGSNITPQKDEVITSSLSSLVGLSEEIIGKRFSSRSMLKM